MGYNIRLHNKINEQKLKTIFKDHLWITYMEYVKKNCRHSFNSILFSPLVENKTLAQNRAWAVMEFLFFLAAHIDKWELYESTD